MKSKAIDFRKKLQLCIFRGKNVLVTTWTKANLKSMPSQLLVLQTRKQILGVEKDFTKSERHSEMTTWK